MKVTFRKKFGLFILAAYIGVFAGMTALVIGDRQESLKDHRSEELSWAVREQIQELNALEWRAIARQALDPAMMSTISNQRDNLTEALNGMILLNPDDGKLKDLWQIFASYKVETDEEYGLISSGRMQEAEAIDEERVDPLLEQLASTSNEVTETYSNKSRRESNLSYLMISAGFMLSLLVTSSLVWIYYRTLQKRRQENMEKEILEKSEERFRSVAQSANEAIITIDGQGKVVYWNLAATNIFGYEKDEVAGRDITIIIPERFREAYRAGRNLVETTGLTRLAGSTLELVGLRKDNRELPIELSMSRWQTQQGNFFTAIIRDITERKLTEKALHDSEARYRELIGISPDEIAVFDPEGNFITINKRTVELHGYDSVEEMMKLKLKDVIAPEHRYDVLAEIRKFVKTGSSLQNRQFDFLRKDGSIFPAEVNAVVARKKDGQPRYIVCIARDITGRKLAEHKILAQSEDLKAANRQLLTLIRISSEVNQTIDLELLLHHSLDTITASELLDIQHKGGIFIAEGERLNLIASVGHEGNFFEAHKNMTFNDCLCGLAARTGEPVFSTDSCNDNRHTIKYEGMENHGHAIIPLKTADRIVGVLYLYLQVGVEIDESGRELLMTIGNQLAVSIENAKLYEETRALSLHDPLTGMANRTLMTNELKKVLAISKRTGRLFSLIMLDLDFFKKYNDAYGHTEGDRLLVELATLINAEIREIDTAARYGGEEFLVILPDTDAEQAAVVAERIRKSVESKDFLLAGGHQSSRITISLGVATYDEQINHEDVLLARADSSLYRAKGNGRNRVEAWITMS